MVVDVADFETEVIERSHSVPVVVDFWAEWCGPCRYLGPILEGAAQKGGFVLAKVDVDAHPELAARFGVQGIPAVKAFRDGQVVDGFVGARGPDDVDAWLKTVVPSEADRLLDQGRALLARGDLDEAERVLGALEASGALAARARLRLARGDVDGARALVARIPSDVRGAVAREREEVRIALEAAAAPEPGDLQGLWTRAHVAAARGDWDDAFSELLALVRADRKWRDDAARKTMLAWFELLGDQEPTRRWRSRLAQELYK